MSFYYIISTILAGIVMKITTSLDDVIWLSFFMAKGSKLKSILGYICGCTLQIVVGVYSGVAAGGFVEGKDEAKYIISCIATLLLTLYGFFLYTDGSFGCCGCCLIRKQETQQSLDAKIKNEEEYIEYYQESSECIDTEKAKAISFCSENAITKPDDLYAGDVTREEIHVESTPILPPADQEADKKLQEQVGSENKLKEDRKFWSVFVAAVVGSMDELIVYMSIIIQTNLPWWGLIIGGIVATNFIWIFVFVLTRHVWLSDRLQLCPDYAVFWTLATFIFISANLEMFPAIQF